MRPDLLRRIAACALAVVLGACASVPEPVNQLAERTGANAGVLGVQLAKLSRESKEIAEMRAQTIARLHAVNAELRAHYNLDVALSRKAGQAGDLELIDVMKEWHKEVEEIFRGVDEAEAARKAEILSHITSLDTKADALRAVADRLARIAEVEKPEDRARFLAGFVKEVRADVNRELEKDDAAANSAKALLKTVGDSFGASGAPK